jgi:pimeloyl-ACP methyl ester carboxylesterase
MFEYEPFARFWQELASSTRTVFHDRRGTGLSDAGAGLPNLETRVADMHAVLEAAGSSTHVLFGVGDGGAVCALYAATHPEQVVAFIWYGAEARVLRSPDWPYGESPEIWERRVAGIADRWGTLDGVRKDFEDSSFPFDDGLLRWAAKLQRSFCGPGTAEHFERLYAERRRPRGAPDARARL